MKALVTGSHGFVGTHLRALLGERGWSVTGLDQRPLAPGPGESFAAVDLLDGAALTAAVAAADPDAVFHLAALPGRGDEAALQQTLDVNVRGTAHLAEALRRRGKPVRFVHVGSSAMYGAVPEEDDPVTESAPLCPLGVYGWSKVASEAVAMAYQGRGGIDVIGVRPFNHTGPGEPLHLAGAAFAKQIAEIEAGAEPVIHVGWLEAVRDFTDVRDIVRGYVALAERGTPGQVYNLCSGTGTRMRDLLGMLLDKSSVEIEVRPDPSRMRPGDLPRQVGSAARARADAGWTPAIPLADSLDALLADRRAKAAAAGAPGGGS